MPIIVLGEIAGGRNYDALLSHCIVLEPYGVRCLCLDLDTLIHTRRAAGRPKDYDPIAALELIHDEKKNQST